MLTAAASDGCEGDSALAFGSVSGRKNRKSIPQRMIGAATTCGAQRCLERSHDPAEIDVNSAKRPAAPRR